MVRIKLKPIAEQVVVVTGASSGIGLATARLAARRGAGVFLVSRDADALGAIAAATEADGGRAGWAVADVGDAGQVDAAAAAAIARFGRIDGWVNDAGVAIYARLVDTPADEHERLFRTNYWGVVNGSLAAVRHLRASGGAIVNLGSIGADTPSPILGAYAATKAAVQRYTRSLQEEVDLDGLPIAVTLVRPSGVSTPLAEHAANHLAGDARLPLFPYDPEVVARAIVDALEHDRGQSLDRLVSTTVKTNIRAENRREATFSWLDGWTQLVDEKTERSRGMTIELSSWFWEGVMMTGGVLSIDRAYFDITGGRERWLYKVARKHAGGAGEGGFAISLPTLFERSGAQGQYRRFKFEIAKIAERDELPGYALSIETADGREPSLRMRRRAPDEAKVASVASRAPTPSPTAKPAPTPVPAPPSVDAAALIRRSVTGLATRASFGEITAATLATLRAECPGWDYQTLHADFRTWIEGDPARTPVSYQNAFDRLVRRFDAKNRHTLGR